MAEAKQRGKGRRWCVPPAIMRDDGEVLEGSPVLREVEGPLGAALWQALRDAGLWASVPAGERAGLFAGEATVPAAAGGEPVLEGSLGVLRGLATDPAGADPLRVSRACSAVAAWAAARGAAGTALGFAQAAAVAVEEDPVTALEVGRLALRFGRYARAETWLRRAVALARRAANWPAYARAHAELGALFAGRDQPDRARRVFLRTLRAARRHGVREARGLALHGMMRLAARAGDAERAEALARSALRALGREHPRSGELLNEVARLWVARGEHERALPALRRLLGLRAHPGARMAAQALLARAAAGAGNRAMLEEAWTAAWSLLEQHPTEAAALDAALDLAHASAAAHDWGRGGMAARRAVELALAHGPVRAAEVAGTLSALGGTRFAGATLGVG